MSLNIVLVEPEIPWNTGAIARSCGLTHSRLHLIEPLGFSLSDKMMKRAGLDYWPLVEVEVYPNWQTFFDTIRGKRFFLASTKSHQRYTDVKFQDEDFIIFGKETKGLDESLLDEHPSQGIRIPMLKDFGRSLNLANACNIILFEALRQCNFLDLE